MAYIGIDLGTSSVKVLLMDQAGVILDKVSRSYPVSFPKNGYSEQNPQDWYMETIECLKELIEKHSTVEIKSLSVAGQMHGLVILDSNDEVIRPAILWNDGRSIKETEYLNQVIGKDKLSKLVGNIAFPGFTAPKVLWVKENEPDNFNKIAKILLPKDYLIFRLTGSYATDVSDASGTLYFDVANRCWSKEMMEICSIDLQQLPEVYESYEIVSKVKTEVLNELSLKYDITVVAGGGDNAVAAIGTGCIKESDCNISLGTSGTVFIASNEFTVDHKNALHSFGHSNGKYHLMGCMLTAASCGKWWVEDILSTQNYVDELVEFDKFNLQDVYFLPYLMGERSPHNDPYARGLFMPMSLDTSRTKMTRAIYEGVCFGLKDSLEVAINQGIDIKSSTLCGGGAKSIEWAQMLSNILGIEIKIPEIEEGPAYGAAILAAVAIEKDLTLDEFIAKNFKYKQVIKPNLELSMLYQKRYEIFKKIYRTNKDLFQEIYELN